MHALVVNRIEASHVLLSMTDLDPLPKSSYTSNNMKGEEICLKICFGGTRDYPATDNPGPVLRNKGHVCAEPANVQCLACA